MSSSSSRNGLWIVVFGFALLIPNLVAAAEEFEDASIILEHNATDGDYEIVIEATGADTGIVEFSVKAPSGSPVATIKMEDPGGREFLIESPEPTDLQGILDAFPEGNYVFTARTLEGETLETTAALSHALAPATTITAPTGDEPVPADSGVIEWKSVPEATRYSVEIENDELDFTLLVHLPSNATRFAVPAGVLMPDTEYELGVVVAMESGNITVEETSFTTGPER
jgi:hypothetical protein